MSSFLDRERTVAGPGYNRWLVPPAALAVHMCIGQVYGFSVFKEPMSRLLGITKPVPGDWQQSVELYWIFSVAIVLLGLSAAVFGKWVERVGPRRTMLASACCWAGGFFVAAIGVKLHNIWLVYFGYGFIGGIGLGLGYISPVSTLVKWFPDRPGMATGMAIMGFGGGAMIGSPLAVLLMNHFKTATDVGVLPTFVVMGAVYFVMMLFGALIVRVPAADWKPAGYVVPTTQTNQLITTANVTADQAIRTPQFYFLWVILCFNVTAGIGILEQAAPMIQEMFPASFPKTTPELIKSSAAVAGGFVGLLSLFNLIGRFVWSSISDYIGRRRVYMIYLGLGVILYALIPTVGRLGSVPLFVCICALILSMYGGGFATVPAYLKDLFGTMQVGAIHGRLLTAWSTAGLLGPILVNRIRQAKIEQGVKGIELYSTTMYLMAGLLAIGFISNLLVRAVNARYHYRREDADAGSVQPAMTPSAGAVTAGSRVGLDR